MDSVEMQDQSRVKELIPPVTREILELSKDGQNPEELETVLQGMLDGPLDEEKKGLLSYLTLILSARKLPMVLSRRLFETFERARFDSKLLDDVAVRVDFTEREIREYFMHKATEYNYVQPTLVKDPLGDLVIDFGCMQAAANIVAELEADKNPAIVVQGYHHPKTHNPGVWMSYKGIKFDPTKFTDR